MPKIKKSERDIGIVTKKNKKGVIEYYARIVKVMPDGSKQQITKKGKNKTHAKELLDNLRRDVKKRGEKAVEGYQMTFSDLAKHYRSKKLKPAEYHGEGDNRRKVAGMKHSQHPKRHLDTLASIFGKKKIGDISPQDIEDYKELRLKTPKENEKPRSFATVHRELEVFRSCLNYAVREDWLADNPFKKVKSLISKSDEVERDRVLSFAEEARLLAACGNRTTTYKRGGRNGGRETTGKNMGKSRKHLQPIIICALDTGMRRGELLKLEWRDINFGENYIRVRQTITKTAKSRIVPLSTRMKNFLLELRTGQETENSLVFGISDNVKSSWRRLVSDAKITGLRFHDLRHTAITRMIRAGIPASEVMKISGHTQMSTFLRYLNITPEAIGSVSEQLERYNAQQSQEVLKISGTSQFIN